MLCSKCMKNDAYRDTGKCLRCSYGPLTLAAIEAVANVGPPKGKTMTQCIFCGSDNDYGGTCMSCGLGAIEQDRERVRRWDLEHGIDPMGTMVAKLTAMRDEVDGRRIDPTVNELDRSYYHGKGNGLDVAITEILAMKQIMASMK